VKQVSKYNIDSAARSIEPSVTATTGWPGTWRLFLVIALFLAAREAGAAVVALPTTYDKLEESKNAGTTVVVGQATFSDFIDLTGDLKDTDVTVSARGGPMMPGLAFDFNLSATGDMNIAETKSITFGYQVDAPSGIAAALLSFSGMGDVAGGAIPSVQKTLTWDNTTATLNVTLTAQGVTKDSTLLAGAPMTVIVRETATVTTEKTGMVRTAKISGVADDFIVLPEPSSSTLAGVCLLLLVVQSRRRV
jgi:hypothetical protein